MRRKSLKITLISTYELGRQPFGLASPAAWLREAGHDVTCVDVAVEKLTESAVRSANLVAFFLPMHTATRLAIPLIRKIKLVNPRAHICAYGLYAPMNADYLREIGVQTILGGEFETPLLHLADRLRVNRNGHKRPQPEPHVFLDCQQFRVPDRHDLPGHDKYAHLLDNGTPPRLVGYVEASRGCKHTCRHCPVVPIYQGRFRIVQKEVVLADIRQQIDRGATHITFGDPDFLNGPGHAIPIVEALHAEFPHITYDVTVKVEHLLKHADLLPIFKQTGCAIVTSAVESLDPQILQYFDKGHTREDFLQVVQLFDENELILNPTFVTFTPWTTVESYRELLRTLATYGLIEHVAPIQLAIRLLIPEGSLLLDLPEVQERIGHFNQEKLIYNWSHPDPKMDILNNSLMELIGLSQNSGFSRQEIFGLVWETINKIYGTVEPMPEIKPRAVRATIPYLTEPWYC